MSLYTRLLVDALKSKAIAGLVIVLLFFAVTYMMDSRMPNVSLGAGDTKIVRSIFVTFMNENVFMILFMPVFLMCIVQFVSKLFNNNILLKVSHVEVWWNHIMLLLLLFSVIFTTIVFCFLTGVTLYSGIFGLSFLKSFLVFYICSGFLLCTGLFIIGQICLIAILLFRKTYWGLIMPMFLVWGSSIFREFRKSKWISIGEYITSIFKISRPSLEMQGFDFIVIVTFMVISALLYMLGRTILQSTDFYWS